MAWKKKEGYPFCRTYCVDRSSIKRWTRFFRAPHQVARPSDAETVRMWAIYRQSKTSESTNHRFFCSRSPLARLCTSIDAASRSVAFAWGGRICFPTTPNTRASTLRRICISTWQKVETRRKKGPFHERRSTETELRHKKFRVNRREIIESSVMLIAKRSVHFKTISRTTDK